MMLEKKIKLTLEQYAQGINKPIKDCKFLIALSGGVDSITLTHIIDKMHISFSTVHFNHHCHNMVDVIASFCLDISKSLHSINHYSIDLSFSDSNNFESIARKKRYRKLNTIAKDDGYDFILTAHHLDDHIETLFMRKLQKASWTARLGVREKLGKVRRPLLSLTKSDLIKYAKNNSLVWYDDPTNSDLKILRNNIRKSLLPDAVKNNPLIIENLLIQNQKDKSKMNDCIQTILPIFNTVTCSTLGAFLPMDQLKALTNKEKQILFQSIIKKYISCDLPQLSKGHWLSLWDFLNTKFKRGSKFHISTKVSIIHSLENIHFINNSQLEKTPKSISFKPIKWNFSKFSVNSRSLNKLSRDKNSLIINKELFNKGLIVRRWNYGDKFISSNSGFHVKVSKLFTDNKFNYLDKITHPVVTDMQNNIIWIPGLAYSNLAQQNNVSKLTKVNWVRSS